jgi:hypothetical protein
MKPRCKRVPALSVFHIRMRSEGCCLSSNEAETGVTMLQTRSRLAHIPGRSESRELFVSSWTRNCSSPDQWGRRVRVRTGAPAFLLAFEISTCGRPQQLCLCRRRNTRPRYLSRAHATRPVGSANRAAGNASLVSVTSKLLITEGAVMLLG